MITITKIQIITLTMIATCTSIIRPSSPVIDGRDVNEIYRLLNVKISCGGIHPGDGVTFGVDEPHKITIIKLLRKLREGQYFFDYNEKFKQNETAIVETGTNVLHIPYREKSNEILNELINRLIEYLTKQEELKNVTDQFKESFKRLIIHFFKTTPKNSINDDDFETELFTYKKSLSLPPRQEFEAQQHYSVNLLNTLDQFAATKKEKSALGKEKQDVIDKKSSTHVDPLVRPGSGTASQTGSGIASNEDDTSDEDEKDEIETPLQIEQKPDSSSVMEALELASMLPKQQFKPPYRPEFEDSYLSKQIKFKTPNNEDGVYDPQSRTATVFTKNHKQIRYINVSIINNRFMLNTPEDSIHIGSFKNPMYVKNQEGKLPADLMPNNLLYGELENTEKPAFHDEDRPLVVS